MRIDTLKQGDRVELTSDFYLGRFPRGTQGTVKEVRNWPGKNHITVSVLIDGDKCPTEFTPQTSGAIRLARSLASSMYSNPLDLLVENIMDLARENRIDEARIYIKDRIEKDVIRAIRRAVLPAASEIAGNLAWLEDMAAQDAQGAEESIRNTMLAAIQSAFGGSVK